MRIGTRKSGRDFTNIGNIRELCYNTGKLFLEGYVIDMNVFPGKNNKLVKILNDQQILQFNEIVSDFKTIGASVENKEAFSVVADLAEKSASTLTVSDLNRLELAFLRITPIDLLRRRAVALRTRYRNVTSEANYEAYLASAPPDPAAVDNEKLLRADLENLLFQIHCAEIANPARERGLSTLLARVMTGLVIMCVTGLGIFNIYIGLNGKQDLGPALAIALTLIAGAAGGFISVQQRLHSLRIAEMSEDQIAGGWMAVLMSPITGAFFALVLYVLFMAKLLEGDLFPKFVLANGTEAITYSVENLQRVAPADISDFGRLIAWGVLAGFAERFVPDILTRFASQQKMVQQNPLPATGSVSAASS